MRLALVPAARRTGIGHRTLERWVEEGMTTTRVGRRIYVELAHVLAWKRWKSLQHPPSQARRRSAAARGEKGAVVAPREVERTRREWIAAGGKDRS